MNSVDAASETVPANKEIPLNGLSEIEAAARLQQYGPNTVSEPKRNPWLAFLRKFWAPTPWMLEVIIVLEVVLGHVTEAAVIAALLVFNAFISRFQEGRAENALALLKQRLAVNARVLRDGNWRLIPAEQLVPGDVAHLRVGDLVPADLQVTKGEVDIDRSTLTGESLPVEVGPGEVAHSGSIVTRGEATGEVTATGDRTLFGKTAELVGTAAAKGRLQGTILTIVKYLVGLDAVLVVTVLVYAALAHLSFAEALPFALVLLVASVPVALEATFTLATALGSQELVKRGVLVTRLSAIEEAAAMETLWVDKTGTITKNQLAVAAVVSFPPYSDDDVLQLGTFASDESTQDPIDLAIFRAAQERGVTAAAAQRRQFTPFDPATKRSEAIIEERGQTLRVVKGAPPVLATLVDNQVEMRAETQRLSEKGFRVIAVATGSQDGLSPAGLIALEDPPREDSPSLIAGLRALGIRVMMVTGDGLATSRTVADRVGIGNRACAADAIHKGGETTIPDCDVIARVYPQDKYDLVRATQASGQVTGMTGDGVNDAPALKQAEVGIAVQGATDVAKAAASIVLTDPGLGDILAAVESSRRIYQRMLTYTLNKIIKTLQIGVLLTVGLLATRSFVVTPVLIVLLLFANDFVTMSISTDRVSFSKEPDQWQIRNLVVAGMGMAGLILVLSFGVLFVGRSVLHLSLKELQTLVFLLLVFTGQGTVYLVRERGHFWNSRPSNWLLASSIFDLIFVSFLAIKGILMTPVSPALVAGVLVAIAAYMALADWAKIRVMRHVGLHPRAGGNRAADQVA